jgi:hypothetical protein
MAKAVTTSTASSTRHARQTPTIQRYPNTKHHTCIARRVTAGLCAGEHVRGRVRRFALLSRSSDLASPYGLGRLKGSLYCMFALPFNAGLLMLSSTQPVQAANPQLVLLDTGNTAVLQSLRQLNKAKDRFGTQDPPAALSSRFTVSTSSCSLGVQVVAVKPAEQHVYCVPTRRNDQESHLSSTFWISIVGEPLPVGSRGASAAYYLQGGCL